jgi:hypothetical protein
MVPDLKKSFGGRIFGNIFRLHTLFVRALGLPKQGDRNFDCSLKRLGRFGPVESLPAGNQTIVQSIGVFK